jgi:hypothetical protein
VFHAEAVAKQTAAAVSACFANMATIRIAIQQALRYGLILMQVSQYYKLGARR